MKNRILLMCCVVGLFLSGKVFSQVDTLNPFEYKIIAHGTDSPIPNLQIVCFNKYFNQDYLSANFRKKYNLDDKTLYKKKMLVQIFHSDKDKKGLDKIDLIRIKEDKKQLVIEYNVVNANLNNDDNQLSPFLIIQVPKSKKKIKFIADGVELGQGTEVYVD
ncbi:MAG: hypothetical protein AAGA43_16375 [Bacteroidota bacterium]